MSYLIFFLKNHITASTNKGEILNRLILRLTRRIVIYGLSGSIIFYHFLSVTLPPSGKDS
jgi:hypothetical protein